MRSRIGCCTTEWIGESRRERHAAANATQSEIPPTMVCFNNECNMRQPGVYTNTKGTTVDIQCTKIYRDTKYTSREEQPGMMAFQEIDIFRGMLMTKHNS
uniref:Retrotransposon protein n=1 Tax=Ascaris lumbricoides TaxID=6252 RepID=A0A0M3I9L8_ASCLU